MKPILFITDANFLSHLTRCIEIAKELRGMGEEIVFAASGRYINILKNHNFKTIDVFTNDPAHTMDATRKSMFRYYDYPLLKKCSDSEIDCIKLVNPKVVVGDFRWSLRVSAQYCRIPYAAIINTLWTPYYSLRRSIPEKLLLRKILGVKICQKLGPHIKKIILTKRGKPFLKLRKELDIARIKNLNTEMCGDLNLMPDIPQLYPTSNLPENFIYIGPLFSNDDTLPITSNIKLPDKPYIYCTLGSTATPKMINLIFEALGDKNIDVVMTTGKQHIGGIPPKNFILFDYLPANLAFKNAVCVICHGGHGTLYQALSYGTPIIGIATHNDQQWNLDRITALQLGSQFGEESCSPEQIFESYMEISSNNVYKNNCLGLKKIIDSYNAPKIAAEQIIKLSV